RRRPHRSSFHRLLIRITIEGYPVQTVHQLAEAGTVQTVDRRAAPEVWDAEEAFGGTQQIHRTREPVRQLRDVDGVAERDPSVGRDAEPIALALLDRDRRRDRQTVDLRRRIGRRAAQVRGDVAEGATVCRRDLVYV